MARWLGHGVAAGRVGVRMQGCWRRYRSGSPRRLGSAKHRKHQSSGASTRRRRATRYRPPVEFATVCERIWGPGQW